MRWRAVVFDLVSPIAWTAALLIAAGHVAPVFDGKPAVPPIQYKARAAMLHDVNRSSKGDRLPIPRAGNAAKRALPVRGKVPTSCEAAFSELTKQVQDNFPIVCLTDASGRVRLFRFAAR